MCVIPKVVSTSLICEGVMLAMCELRPPWLANDTKMYAIMSSTDYVAALEPRARQRYSEKLDIVGNWVSSIF